MALPSGPDHTSLAPPGSQDAQAGSDNVPHTAGSADVPLAESPRPSQPPADDAAHVTDVASSTKRAHQAQSPKGRPPPRAEPHKGERQEGQQKARDLANWQPSIVGEPETHVSFEDVALLREHVARVTETAACLRGLDSNEAECEQVKLLSGSIPIVAPSPWKCIQEYNT